MNPGDIISSLRTNCRRGRVFAEHVPLRCICGVFDWERLEPSTLFADIAITYDWSDCVASDEIADALDYAAVASEAMAFAEKTQYHLVESLANSICRHLLSTFRRALAVELKIKKKHPSYSGTSTSFACATSERRSLAVLGIGSNLGDSNLAIKETVKLIGAIPHCRLLRSSSLHRTAPLLFTEQPEFLNRALLIETLLSPAELLGETQAIENAMGRLRQVRHGPRTIDIDLLLFEGVTSSAIALTVPHHGLRSRRFCIEELADLGLGIVPETESVMEQGCEQIEPGESF
ncbi:MAG: 2-amino-4-hydroxy-6-hydroxymethyldihydropteridine diphosphokinase [Puniceicoccales bacterium]|jgi:2-amino-4-hydroxy-6-hydroxymethyldihydropteridine diphosphokinase|nr:2-amino-4-hydroxy-6-hydroxymethyldihydropteridine diphosphokinase [Puniceicoccales bacterium]